MTQRQLDEKKKEALDYWLKSSQDDWETELQRVNRLNEEKLKKNPSFILMAQKMVENLNGNALKDSKF